MITTDTALTKARETLAPEASRGGLVTMYGFSDHWLANCTFPGGNNRADTNGRTIKIDMADGSVTVVSLADAIGDTHLSEFENRLHELAAEDENILHRLADGEE